CWSCFREFATDLRYFLIQRHRCAICPDDRTVILLLPVECAAPLPIADGVGTVADVVPRHGANLAFVERGVYVRPVDRTGLRFHHPEVLALEAARKVVSRAILYGIEVTLSHVVIPGGEIEVLLDGVVIEAVEPSHRVGGDELAGI